MDEYGKLSLAVMGNSLDAQPFSFQTGKDGVVRIFRSQRLASTLKGREAQRFLTKVTNADEQTAQGVMARITGQYKFGNERQRKYPKN